MYGKKIKKIILFIFLIFFVISKNYASEILTGDFFNFNSKLPIEISAEVLEIDAGSKNSYIFYYKNNVVLIQGPNKIYSDFLTIFYDRKNKKIIKADIKGHIKIKGNNVICSCNKAYYTFNNEKIVLKGNVKVLQNDNIFYGEELVIDMKNNRTFLKSGNKKRINTYFSGNK